MLTHGRVPIERTALLLRKYKFFNIFFFTLFFFLLHFLRIKSFYYQKKTLYISISSIFFLTWKEFEKKKTDVRNLERKIPKKIKEIGRREEERFDFFSFPFLLGIIHGTKPNAGRKIRGIKGRIGEKKRLEESWKNCWEGERGRWR